MTLRIGDRAKETAAAPGTGDVTLGGAVVGFTAISAIPGMGNGDTVYYAISNGGALWETGLGTYVSSGNKLQRTTIYQSSNSNLAVNFTGAVTVWGDAPASRVALLDASGNLNVLGAVTSVKSQNSGLKFLAQNTNVGTGVSMGFRADNGTHNSECGVLGENWTTSGALIGGRAYFQGSGDLAIIASGVVVFASGGVAEKARFDTSGNLIVGAATSAGGVGNLQSVVGGVFVTQVSLHSIPDGGDTTVQFIGVLADFGVYRVSASIGGTGGGANLSGEIVCGDSNMRPAVATLASGSYPGFAVGPLEVILQTMNNGTAFEFGDGDSFQVIFSNTAGVGTLTGKVTLTRTA